MELTYACSSCGKSQRLDSVESTAAIACPSCGASHPIREGTFSGGDLERCAECGTQDLYIQKDFPQGLGLAIVIVGFAISTAFWYWEMPIWTYAILLGSALLDLALYYLVPDVTICYRCLGQHRGSGANPGGRSRPFDLAIGERYRQERIRVEELRGRAPPGPNPPTP